jgi:hypothetical protein
MNVSRTNIGYDLATIYQLNATAKPTSNVQNGTWLLAVDTATWFVFFNGTWYPQ